jgi:MIP family channel proteins
VLDGDYLRRGVAEFIGTFTLIFVGGGAAAFVHTTTDAALANGLAIGVMIVAMGHISGGLFNPAITLGFLVTKRISPKLAGFYWLVQFAGGAVGGLMLKWLLPSAVQHFANLGVPALGSGMGAGAGVVLEAILTFFLVWVVFGAAVDPDSAFKQVAGLAIGLTISIDVLIGGGLTGAAMNPARAFGPELAGNHWANAWVWYVGPAAGAVIAASVYEMLYLRRPASEAAASAS